MPKKVLSENSDEDNFETEAFQFLNKEKNEAESDSENSGTTIKEENDDQVDDDENDYGDVENNESDDEAPESIGFSESRKNVLSQFRTAMKQVDQERQRQKEKRKQKEVLFKEQKEKKRKYINETKLPDDILQDIDSTIPRSFRQKKKMLKQEWKGENEELDDKKPKVSRKTQEKSRHKQPTEQPKPVLSDDYIPLVDSESGIEVTDVRQYEKQVKSLAQKAADFRNSRLYGKDIPRETNNARLLKLEKKRARMK